MNPTRLIAALNHAREIREKRKQHILEGPGFLFSYQCIDSDIKRVEHGDHSEDAIKVLEDKK